MDMDGKFWISSDHGAVIPEYDEFDERFDDEMYWPEDFNIHPQSKTNDWRVYLHFYNNESSDESSDEDEGWTVQLDLTAWGGGVHDIYLEYGEQTEIYTLTELIENGYLDGLDTPELFFGLGNRNWWISSDPNSEAQEYNDDEEGGIANYDMEDGDTIYLHIADEEEEEGWTVHLDLRAYGGEIEDIYLEDGENTAIYTLTDIMEENQFLPNISGIEFGLGNRNWWISVDPNSEAKEYDDDEVGGIVNINIQDGDTIYFHQYGDDDADSDFDPNAHPDKPDFDYSDDTGTGSSAHSDSSDDGPDGQQSSDGEWKFQPLERAWNHAHDQHLPQGHRYYRPPGSHPESWRQGQIAHRTRRWDGYGKK
jgi:hypothetical protein